MTVLAEKSTRFPIKFPLTLPSLPFSLAFTAFSGLPDFCVALGNPEQEGETNNFNTVYIKKLVFPFIHLKFMNH